MGMRPRRPPTIRTHREPAITKSKTIAAVFAALTLAASLTAVSSEAQAKPKWGWVGAGVAAGALVGIAAANSYGYGYGYRDCRFIQRVDYWGNVRTIKVCDY